MIFPSPRILLALGALASALPALAAEPETKRCQYLNIANLPLHYRGPSLQIATEGRIEGKPASILVDTGAWDTLLTSTGAERHGLPLSVTVSTAEGIGGYARIYNTKVRDFSVGPAKWAPGYIQVLADHGTPPSYDAVAGASFLLQTDLEISLATKELRFFHPRQCSPNHFLAYWDKNAVEVPFSSHLSDLSSSENPPFTVVLNGKKLNAIIDTGASDSFVTVRGARKAGVEPNTPEVERKGHVTGVGEDKVAYWTATFDSLQIGEETIGKVPIRILDTDLDVDMLLGADFLRSHRVLFAMSQRKLYISYVGGPPFSPARGGIEPWVRREADSGNADAQLAIAASYQRDGDAAQARHWMERAAGNGNPAAQVAIGILLLEGGDYAGATASLRKALDLTPRGRDAALWLYVARVRNGQAELGRKELDSAFAGSEDGWPRPIAAFHLGKLNEEKLLAEAQKGRGQARQWVCQAWSHITARRAIVSEAGHAQAAHEQERKACAAKGADE